MGREDLPRILICILRASSLNHWGLVGSWNVNSESAVLQSAPGKVLFRLHSRDLHLVLAPSKDGKPVRFRVTLDGATPGENCGVDTAPDGTGEIRGDQQLVEG